MLLATAAGLAGFLAVCATALILVWVIEELEDQRCPECAVVAAVDAGSGADSAAASVAAADVPLQALMTTRALAGLPAFAVGAPPSRVRVTRRARHAATPVFLERDRRDPRRHGTPTFPEAPSAPVQVGAVHVDRVAGGASPIADVADRYPAGVAA
jgi:hypothetical protein